MPNGTSTTGFTSGTPDHLLIDAGAVYKDYGLSTEAIIGATSGGNEFDITKKTYDPKIDGLPDTTIKGLTRVTSIEVTLKANFVEVTTDILKMALGADADTVSNQDYDIITGRNNIAIGDYITNVALVGKLSGSLKPVVIILKNALCKDGIKFSNKDNADNVLPVTFTATLDPTNVDASPYEIHMPKLNSTNPFYMVSNPIIDDGKIRIDFSDNVASTVPLAGFTATVNSVADVITAATRDANDLSVVKLTLTTAPTSGQTVTLAYSQPTSDTDKVKSASGRALETFTSVNVTNN